MPVDEVPAESVPISGMSEQLLAKAESLGRSPVFSLGFSNCLISVWFLEKLYGLLNV